MGLTALDRRILQTIVDVEKAGGQTGVSQLKLLLCVDSMHVAWVAEQAAAKAHWTLQPEQIVITSIARFPGMMWEDVTKWVPVTQWGGLQGVCWVGRRLLSKHGVICLTRCGRL